MYIVEIHLKPVDLSDTMAAMRIWLDERRLEPSIFTCREVAAHVLLTVSFRSGGEAEAFAGRFDGRVRKLPDAIRDDAPAAAAMVG